MLIFYLTSALTGLWWSYDWYRGGLQSMLGGERVEKVKAKGKPSFDLAWQGFDRATAGSTY